MVSKPPCIPARLLPKTNTSLGLRLVIKSAQWKNSGGVTRWTLQTFRIAANWHIDLQLATIPYFLLFQKPLKSRYFRPRIPLRANRRLSWAIKWRFWDTISLFLRWIFLWTYVLRFMEVRPKGACTYVLRVHARTSIEFMAEMLPQFDWRRLECQEDCVKTCFPFSRLHFQVEHFQISIC